LEYPGERYVPPVTVHPAGTSAPEKSAVSVTTPPAKADKENKHAAIAKEHAALLLILLSFCFPKALTRPF
jgi:hypothetical protein